MEMFTSFFEQLLKMSVTASVVILAVLLARLCLRRLPKKYSYLLWAVVLFRLICPISVSSAFSIFNFLGYKWKRLFGLTDSMEAQVVMAPNEEIIVTQFADAGSEAVTAHEYTPGTYDYVPIEATTPMWLQIATILWLLGIGVILFYSIYTYWKFRGNVAKATLLRDNIYECENISSPFVMGIVSPRIYIPYRLGEEEQKYILAHERYHITRCDHLVKVVAFLVFTVYWFHPLVWISYFLMCRDMEMSCDEKVLSMLGSEIRQDYSMLLLSFATNRRFCLAGPLAFGESDTGKRVKNVLHFRQPKLWGSVLGIVLLAAVILGCATNEEDEDALEVIETVELETGEDTVEVESDETTYVYEDTSGEDTDGDYKINASTVESADPEELSFIQDWVIAFSGRDGTAINEMVTEEGRTFMEENFDLTDHGGEYSMGWSSPWPMNGETDWRILSVKDGKSEILFYAWVSNPHYSVWRMELAYEKIDDAYKATPKEMSYFDAIAGAEEFFMAYPGGVIRDTPMDFLTNGMGEVLNNHAMERADSIEEYAVLLSPETAAGHMLNIDPNQVRTHVPSADSKEQGMTYVAFQFSDGTNIFVEMIQPYGEDGIWIPQAVLDEAAYVKVLEEGVEEKKEVLKDMEESLEYIEESLPENLLPHQSSMAPIRVYRIYNYFADPHEGGLDEVTADLNGDGVEEKIYAEDLSHNGGDGGYSIHVVSAKTGEEIPLPDVIAGEKFPFSTIWNEKGMRLTYEDIEIALVPKRMVRDLYEREGMPLAEDALDKEQVMIGDAASGFAVKENADGSQELVIKYYLSGLYGHADCFGYGIVHLQLNEDNTWEMEKSFAVDL